MRADREHVGIAIEHQHIGSSVMERDVRQAEVDARGHLPGSRCGGLERVGEQTRDAVMPRSRGAAIMALLLTGSLSLLLTS
ncbi:hypothetical protein GCM10023195_26600 [Actinoallomurus liliacearum]|uniref:Uncharacterized protein n=1 Tax=Actinoallomurus liliacearum TaxID=1080073 RepID=A0ABP8TFP1_9ACTN